LIFFLCNFYLVVLVVLVEIKAVEFKVLAPIFPRPCMETCDNPLDALPVSEVLGTFDKRDAS
jgi:hypothetical protein